MSLLLQKLSSTLRAGATAGVLALLGVSTALVAIWFRRGLIIATGESGLPFYNPQFFFKESNYVWSNQILGGSAPSVLASLPLYYVLGSLSHFGVPGFVLEAGTFWVILTTASISVFKLTLQGSKREELEGTVAGLFYILNPYAVTAIWNRMLYTHMFAYALLPFALFLYLRGIESKKMRYAGYLGGATVLFSYSFSSLAFVFVFWILIMSACLLSLVLIHGPKVPSFILKFTALSAVVFIIVNSWWLLNVAAIVFVSQNTSGEKFLGPDLGTLLFFASKSGLTNVMRLMPFYWSNFAQAWDAGLDSPLLLSTSFLIPLVSFSALHVRTHRRSAVFYGVLSLWGLTVANGASPPLGGLFLFAYERVPFAILFRNPWEKLGILYSLAISPLFGIGWVQFYYYLRSHIRLTWRFPTYDKDFSSVASVFIPLMVIFLLLGVLVWPMWTGRVFEGTAQPNPGDYIQVPPYYDDARQWLASRDGIFRIIVLPLGGEGTTYVWNQSGANLGFNGVNIDNLLFGVPSISLPDSSAFGDTITKLPGLLVANGTIFWKVLSLLSARYVVVREDSNYTYRGELSSQVLRQALESSYVPSSVSNGVDLTSLELESLYDEKMSGSLASVWSTPVALNFSINAAQQSRYGIFYETNTLVFPPNNYSNSGVNYFLPASLQDFSQAKFMEVWIRANQSINLSIGLANMDGSSIGWGGPIDSAYSIGPLEVNTWKLFILPISNPSDHYRSFNINSGVERIGFAFFGPPRSVPLRVEIGGVFKDKGVPLKTPHIRYTRSFGELHFYKLDDDRFVPIVYPATRLVLANSIADFVDRVLVNTSFIPGQSVALLRTVEFQDYNTMATLHFDPRNRPQLRFRSIDPTRYEISAANVTGPFILVLNQSFDPRWAASYGATDSPNSSTRIARHFMINGFGNGWLVTRTGNLTISLHFEPQDLFVYAAWVSSSSLIILMGTMAIATLRYRIRNREILSGNVAQ